MACTLAMLIGPTMLALVASFGVLVLAGLWLTLRAIFPKRHGDTPFCRKCRYNLTGTDLQSPEARCPECGAPLSSPRAVRRGERRANLRRVSWGLVLVLFGLAPLAGLTAGAIYQVDWYAYKPTGWVLQDAAANSPALAGQAFGELKRRWVSGGLNPQQISTLTETALAEQALSQLRPGASAAAVDILDRLYRAQGLTEKQVQRFFNQMVLINLVVRSPVVAGQAAPAALKVDYRGPTNVYEPRIKVRRVEIDGKCAESGRSARPDSAWTAWRASNPQADLHIRTVGKHTIDVMTDFQIVPEGPDDSEWLPDDQARFSGKRKLSAAMEVIPTEPPDLFHMRHSDELDRAVVDIVRGSDVRLVDPIGPFSAIFILGWDSAPPIGLAFDFFAEVNGRIVPISQRSIPNEKYRVELIENAGRLPEHVTIILRASKAAALRTPDLFEIWDGELWFENIPVLPRGSSPGDYYRAQVRRMNPAEQYPPCEADKWHGPLGEWPIDDPNEAQDTSASAIVQQLLGLGGTRDAGHRDHNAAQRVDHAAQEQLAQDLGRMSEAERRAFFDEHLQLSVRMRPKVVQDRRFKVEVSIDSAPSCKIQARLFEIRSSDNQAFPCGATCELSGIFAGLFGPVTIGGHAVLNQPGKYTLEAKLELKATPAPDAGATDGGDWEFHETRTLTGEIEVVPEETPDLLRLVRSDEIDSALSSGLTLSAAQYAPGPSDRTLKCTLYAPRDLPTKLVLGGHAEFGDRRVALEEPVTFPSRQFHVLGSTELRFKLAGEPPPTVTVVLQTDRDYALENTEWDEIWDGELRFENVPVQASDSDYRQAPVIRHPE